MYVGPFVNAGKLVVKTLLHSTTSGKELHRVPLKTQHLSLVHVDFIFLTLVDLKLL